MRWINQSTIIGKNRRKTTEKSEKEKATKTEAFKRRRTFSRGRLRSLSNVVAFPPQQMGYTTNKHRRKEANDNTDDEVRSLIEQLCSKLRNLSHLMEIIINTKVEIKRTAKILFWMVQEFISSAEVRREHFVARTKARALAKKKQQGAGWKMILQRCL